MLTALYNIVDQIFIGQGVGILGNVATNIAFPLSTTCTAISLLLGIGSATNFSLNLGAGREKESAAAIVCGIFTIRELKELSLLELRQSGQSNPSAPE